MVSNNTVNELVDALSVPQQSSNNVYNAVVANVDNEGVVWVHVEGSSKVTPTASRSAEVSQGDHVSVEWRNNKLYISGNYTTPATDDTRAINAEAIAYGAQDAVTTLNTLVANTIVADNARFINLEADTAKIHNLTAEELSATVGYIDDLTTGNVSASDIVADHAAIEDLDVQSMSAATAYIGALTAGNVSAQNIIADHGTVGSLNTNYAHISNGVIDNATIDHADVDGLSANYAQITAANIDTATARNAWVDAIMVQSGLIASEGAVFYLDAIKVNATNITAGTIDVERIVVTDPTTGDKHMVTWDETTSTWVAAKLDGDVIEDLTITADKIVAGAITADKITTQNIVGTGGWINLRNGTFQYVNATTGEGISWDGSNLTINSSSFLTKAQTSSRTYFATCSTAKSTTAKVATITPTVSNWALYTGAIVTVKFTNENTTTSPTLNVNSTGAKGIRTYSGGTLSEDEYKWLAGSTMSFVYDGTNWRIQDSTELTRLSTAETIIDQTANNVLIKATENDTTTAQGGQHLIQSLINVAPSGVTISADKVNIEGAAIFTGSGRLSTTSLNNTYDANGAATNAVNALTTDLASASGTTVINGGHITTGSISIGQVDNLQSTINTKSDAAAWSLSISIDSINYASNTATLKATVYQYGVEQSSGFTLQWYKNGTAISGATSATLSNVTADSTYTCVAT